MMALAVEEAKKAGEKAEIPIGAIIVDAEGVILSQTHNQTITLRDPTAHAEILALRGKRAPEPAPVYVQPSSIPVPR